MMNASCPDKPTLTQALLGQLLGAPAELLEEHLSSCSACAETLRGLTVGDAVTASLRRGPDTDPDADGAAVTELLDRLRSLLPQLVEREHSVPPVSVPSRPGGHSQAPFKFLAAPEQAGEIGRLAHYRVLRVLGQGGMGVVFEAEDARLQRRVALKVMLPKLAGDAESRARFILEARAAAIQHPRLVTVFEVGETADVPFLAMELLQGESLESRLRRQPGPYPTPVLLKIGRQIAEGLAAVHGLGIIHRDIKPSNVWLQAGSEDVRLLDFGLARAATAEARLTQPGMIVGTPGFLAPEQAAGKAVDARSDLFSLGAVLYLLATGTMPFEGRDVLATLNALATSHPRPASELNTDLPEALCHLITRLLSKQPALRPGSAREVIDVLDAMHASAAAGDAARRLSAGKATPAALPKRSSRKAIVLATVIGGPIVVLAVLAVIFGTGMLGETLGDRPPAPHAENKREQPREEQRRPEQPREQQQPVEEQPREEDREVAPGVGVPNAPAVVPLPAELVGKASVNLIPPAVPPQDVVRGRWSVANKALHCTGGSFVPRIQFPYRPPAEYDFVVTFWQPKLRNGISLIMPNPNGGAFFWFLGNEAGAGYGFHARPKKEGRQLGLIKAESVHTTVVQVRKGSVRALVDGKELLRLQTDYRDLLCDNWRRMPNTELVAVACDDPTVFYHIRIVEVSGPGIKGR
jgi:hypothetical protein